MQEDLQQLERRLVAIEQSNRRWKFSGIVLGLGLFLATSMAADKPEDAIPDVIYARKFVAVNERNEPVAFMGHEKNVGIVSVAAADGTLLFAASATDSGHGVVSTFDREGRALVCVSANQSGDGHITVFDDRGDAVSQRPEASRRSSVQPVSSRGRSSPP
ncbi:MAG TPA: hypothetical protein VNH11_28980 [Pirellulales bacterium]|nr:hypothetical protein [Pirellulales bacterium]